MSEKAYKVIRTSRDASRWHAAAAEQQARCAALYQSIAAVVRGEEARRTSQ